MAHPALRTSHVTHLQQALASGQTTCEAWVEQSLADAAQPHAAHVFTHLWAESALASARHADAQRRSGVRLGPLAGLPVTIKDLFDVAGETTTSGSVVCASEAPAECDAPPVARLRASGAALLGKTNMSEFAFSGVGYNPHWGTPANPADASLARIPGGSSSGAAVSVGLGLAVAGLGSDTGGSLRIPAALCGLVGFKGSQSRVTRMGAMELARSLDTVGAITRCVNDAWLLDAVLSGQALSLRQRSVKGLRLAVPTTLMQDELDADVSQAFARSLSCLSAAGALIEEVTWAELGEIATLNAPGGFSPVEAYAAHRHRLAADGARFDQRVAQRMALGQGVSAADYLTMIDQRRAWIARSNGVMQGFDAVMCPTVPMVAPAIDATCASDAAFFAANRLLLRNTFAINYWDGCAISMPCQAPGDLPVGLMLARANGDDADLLGVALAIEAALA
jgi:aspartyl-tRNA(Asn)/glutamyl-tRNA(Gln) amidotransferase subunit A